MKNILTVIIAVIMLVIVFVITNFLYAEQPISASIICDELCVLKKDRDIFMERKARLESQSQLLQIGYEQTNNSLNDVNKKISDIENKLKNKTDELINKQNKNNNK